MPLDSRVDESGWRQLPLPLAQLCRRAANAKTDIDGHLTAFSLAEVALKLLSSTAIVHYAEHPAHDAELVETLRKLARPSLGHWWEFSRKLIPVLAPRLPAYERLQEVLFNRVFEDCPRAAGLNAALLKELGRSKSQGLSVRFRDLIDHIVEYRNKILFHAAPAQLPPELHRQMSAAFLLGISEMLTKVDVLAGNQLSYISEVKKAQGKWQVTRFELIGENPRRQPVWELPREAVDRLPDEGRVYLQGSDQRFRSLYPLALFDLEHEEFLLLNSRRGTQRADYLCYTSGRTEELADLEDEQRELLADILQIAVSENELAEWAAVSRAEESLESPDEDEAPAHRTLGEFELISELGRGGMGVVYRARQPSLRREVALKKLLRTGGGSEQRFLREIRALGRVEHPNLVKILTSGSVGEDWYYAMELVDGVPMSAVCSKLKQSGSVIDDLDLSTWEHALTTACVDVRNHEKPVGDSTASGAKRLRAATAAELPQRLKSGRGYVERVVDLMRQAAGAVDALHEEGIIHRDVKPGNIMVTADGQRALLMDLGLAQLADEEDGRLTRTRQFVGTLRYASPEQVLAAEKVDRRSDIYGLGATLWELLTLRPIFDADDQVPEAEVMRRIQLDEPDPVRKHNARVDRDLDAIIGKCLEKRPDRRYATARELSEDLRRWQRREPVLARRVTKLEKGARWFARRPALATACVFGFLTLVLGSGSGLALWGYLKANEARNELKTANDELKTSNASLEEARKKSDEEAEKALAAERKANDAAALARQKADEASKARDELKTSNAQLVEAQRLLQRGSYADQVLFAQNLWQMGNAVRARERLNECAPELRGFEWNYLLTALTEHERAVAPPVGKNLFSALSADGRRAAIASVDGLLMLWDASSVENNADETPIAGRLINRLDDPDRKLRSLAASRDGSRLAVVDEANRIRVFDFERGTLLGEVDPGTPSAVLQVAFSPDGQLLAAACDDHRIRTWRTSGRIQSLQVLDGHTDTVNTIAFTADGRGLASGGYDGQLLLWDPETATILQRYEAAATSAYSTNSVSQIAFRPDGERMISCGTSGEIRMWDVESGKQLAIFQRDLAEDLSYAFHFLSFLTFSPDGRYVVAAESQEILLWELPADGRIPAADQYYTPRYPVTSVLQGHTNWVFALTISPDSIYLASAGSDQSIRLWNLAAAVAGAATATTLPATSSPAAVLYGHEADPGQLAFSEDGSELISVDSAGSVRRWDVAVSATDTASEVLLTGHFDRIANVRFTPDGSRFATGSNDGNVCLWDTQTLELVRKVSARGVVDPAETSYEYVTDVAFDAGGAWMLTATDVGRVQLFQADSSDLIATLQVPTPKSGDLSYKGLMRTIAFSQLGMKVAIAGDSAEIHVWDVKTNSELAQLIEHTGEITDVSFSPRGDRLASAGSDGKVCLWNAELNSLERVLEGHAGRINCIAFSPDGQRLASAGEDHTVRVWDVATGQPIWTAEEQGPTVDNIGPIHLTFDSTGRRLASAGDDGTVIIWNAATGAAEHRLAGHTNVVRYVAFSPRGDRLASASGDYTARVWDVASGGLICELKDPEGLGRYGHTDWVNMVVWHPDGLWVATCSDDKTVQIWDPETGEHLQTFGGHGDWVRAIAVSADGTRLASACDDQQVRIWDTSSVMSDIAPDAPDVSETAPAAPESEEFLMSTGDLGATPWSVFAGHLGTVRYVEFLGDGQQTISGVTTYGRGAKLWTTDTGTEVASYDLNSAITESGTNILGRTGFNHDGTLAASAQPDRRTLQIWTVPAGTPVAECPHPRAIQTFAWNPKSNLIATGSLDGKLRLWQGDTGELIAELEGHAPQTDTTAVNGGVRHVVFSMDGRLLATAGGDQSVRLWNVPEHRWLQTMTGHQAEVEQVAFSPGGKWLASCSVDETAKLWNVADGQLGATLAGHDGAVESLAFNADGTRILTCSLDGSMRLWDAETGRTVAIFQMLKNGDLIAPEAAFDPLGRCIAATTTDYQVDLLKTTETEAQRNRRRRQWRRAAADSAIAAFNWEAAVFHLQRLVPELPDDGLVNYQYGNALAELDRWAEARDAFAQALAIPGTTPTDQVTILLRLGLLQLQLGDVRGYRASCNRMLQAAADARADYTATTSVYDNDIYAAWLAGVSSASPPDWDTFLLPAQDAVSNASAENDNFYRHTLGILRYRAGLYRDAADDLGYAGRAYGYDVESQFVLALSKEKIGLQDEAVYWYIEAMKALGAWTAEGQGDPYSAEAAAVPPPQPIWERRLRREFLRKEAEQVFQDEIAPAAPP